MSNNYEQPIEPMSRVEDILRGDTTAVPMSRVEDLLKQLIEGGGGGSTVTVIPRLAEGVKLATINVDGTDYDIYAPEDVVGSIVTVSPILQSGIKIATITVNQTDYDIYAPEGGSSGGGNLYGTTDPASDLGNNGDIYMKYGHRYVNTSFISSTTSIPWGSTLDVTITDMDTYDSLHIEGTCMIGGYGGQPFNEEWDVNDISDSSSSPSRVTANSDCYMYRDGDTLKFSNTVTSGTITLLEGAKADAPYIIDEYGKIEDEWVRFPNKGYSFAVASDRSNSSITTEVES